MDPVKNTAADKVRRYRAIVRRVLSEYVPLHYANGDIHNEAIFDEEHDRYMVVSVGWQGIRRVHGGLLHVDIVGDKVWIQRDGTEDGIANELVAAGIPKSDLVLGFYNAEERPLTEFAAA